MSAAAEKQAAQELLDGLRAVYNAAVRAGQHFAAGEPARAADDLGDVIVLAADVQADLRRTLPAEPERVA